MENITFYLIIFYVLEVIDVCCTILWHEPYSKAKTVPTRPSHPHSTLRESC